MKVILTLSTISLLFLILSACSVSQSKSTNSTAEAVDLIVTFFSKGGGIDRNIYTEFKQFLTDNYSELKYSETKYGREGETDFCFRLSSLTKKEKEIFLTDAKLILSKSDLVRVQENSPCKH